ncbi:DNA polymerase I [Treponema brennaborense]|uniref:DNA polymerase I n=1 Tax=Treponema brennaborense (strain DSM 12168 / CIP 105900 / DD5/3) TaxID=906968 RepID=F4LK29_TREBD|nr:DNA polymerase I [Treponema brennaborense]AEE17491.1 DNA polymerase I [Treponema brennaborense DSM 12168]
MNDFSDPDSTLYILDSYGLIYRSYYAFINRPLTDKDGKNVSAVFGFFRNFKAVLDHYKPRYIAAAFDSRKATFRHEMYADYKATRQKTPEDLHAQVPVIEEILTALGIPVLRCDGFEADDVIATIASVCGAENRCCRILSADKDLMQLVNDTTQILKPDKNGGWEIVGKDGVKAEWGVEPELMLDLLSLIGDSSDNVPGVSGVGIKTALKLLDEYGSLDGIFAHADDISGAVGNKIRAGKDAAYFSKSLIALRYDVPVDTCVPSFGTVSLDYEAASRLLFRYGVPAVAKQYASVPLPAGSETEAIQSKGPTGLIPDEPVFEELTKNTGDYMAVTSIAVLASYIDEILASEPIEAAFDCETDSLDRIHTRIVGFSLSRRAGTGIYVPLSVPDALLTQTLIEKQDAFVQLERLFSVPACTLAMHNGKFDYEVLRSNGLAEPRCRIADTMVAAWLLDPDRSAYSLEALAADKLGLETIPYTDVVPKGSTFADIPLEQAVPYAAEDADLTWQLYRLFLPRLAAAKLGDLFWNLEMPVLPILAEMELDGIHIEKSELISYGEELTAEIERIRREIYELVGHEFNVASTKQLQDVLFEERKLPPGKKTKTGYSTDTGVLETLAALDPVPRKILDYRLKTKLFSSYVDTLPLMVDGNDRIHTSFIQTGTATGRLSSREPNLQNIPVRDEDGRRIRLAFTAEPGCQLISADYSQIELVILAHLSGDPNLCAAFSGGTDVHRATAALIFGVQPDAVTPDMRRTAKTINFGVMYGMSAFRLAGALGIPRTQAAEFIEAYFKTYAGVRNFMNEMVNAAQQSGFVETIFGRRRYIRAINSSSKIEKSGAERVAVNTPIQGSAADIVKKAMIDVAAALKKTGSPARLLLQVHDELILECPQESAAETASLIKQTMENVVSLRVPLKVSVEIGPRWGDFH